MHYSPEKAYINHPIYMKFTQVFCYSQKYFVPASSQIESCKLISHLIFLFHVRDKILTGSFDRSARIWCSRTGCCLVSLWGHNAEVVTANFSPTQNRVATCSMDATSKIFHISSGNYIKT